MTNRNPDPMIGRTVAHYEIVSRLGGGGMGIVYRAIDHKLGRTVAVKFLPPQWSHDETAKQRFIREAQAASATHHPNICTIHDVETADDGQLFIVMACYEGQTLKQRLEDGPLPVEEALDIATQLADGLAKAHAQDVLHRDIKPGNLILTEDGVRIVDFGLATFADAVQLTAAGSTVGTVAYMSPEQSRGEEADARTDVWAAGVVLYEMLSGRVPFRGSHAEAIAYAIRHDAPAPLRVDRPEIPEEVEQMVFRALHKDPAIRFQSGRELARALRQVRGLTVPHDLRTQAVTPPVSAIRSTARARVVAAAVTLAVLGGGAVWLMLPVERVTVAVAPVTNGTGFRELNDLEFALAEELSAALTDSQVVRVISAGRVREIAKPFRKTGDATGPDAALAIARGTSADILLAPSLVTVDGAVVGRLAIDPSGGVREEIATAPVISGLHHETAQNITLQLASAVEDHLVRPGPVRGRIRLALRRWMTGDRTPRFATLSAAATYERGLEAYERFEYVTALTAFTEAAKQDPRSGLLQAWISRAALVSRRNAESAVAGDRAAALVPDDRHRRSDALFIEAVVAEAQGRFEAADAAYRALVDHDERDASFAMERAAYLDRRGRDEDAAAAYLTAAMLSPTLARADLELCRLYSPRQRLDDVARAKQYAETARAKYQAIGSDAGMAQADMCAVDSQRQGSLEERREAASTAARSRAVLGRPDVEAPYQFARAVYYQALAAYALNDFPAAVTFNEEALAAAERAGNLAVIPFVLQNLAASHSRLGNRRLHIELSRQSADLYAAHGESERAATMQANAGATLIDFGDDPEDGFRLIENAQKVLEQSRRNAPGQVLVVAVSAAYHRYRGRHNQALQLLERALAMSKQAGLQQNIWSLQLDQSRSHVELGDYVAARTLVASQLEGLDPRTRAQGEIWMAQIDMRMGDLDAARARLMKASSLTPRDDQTTNLLFETAFGELEYESGRLAEASAHFHAAARTWEAELPHWRSVEALAYAGLLEALGGRAAAGRAAVQKALDRATLTGRLGLAARCRVFLARIALRQQQADEAMRILDAVAADGEDQTIGPELRAQVHYWKAQAMKALGGAAGAEQELSAARRALAAVRMRLPPDAVPQFDSRADIRRVLQ